MLLQTATKSVGKHLIAVNDKFNRTKQRLYWRYAGVFVNDFEQVRVHIKLTFSQNPDRICFTPSRYHSKNFMFLIFIRGTAKCSKQKENMDPVFLTSFWPVFGFLTDTFRRNEREYWSRVGS